MQKWNFEPGHSAAHFRARHMMVTWVRGGFFNISGSITLDPQKPESASIEATIPINTLHSGEPNRDKHLLQEDFLHEDKYKTMVFKSTSVQQASENDFKMGGDLTLRGITKPVTLEVTHLGQWQCPFWEDEKDKGPVTRAGFTAKMTINRHDFGVSWNSTLDKGGIVVGNDVHIVLEIEALLE